MGPLHFVVFVNDLLDVIKKFNPIYTEEKYNNLRQDLNSAEKWARKGGATPDKCCHVRIGHSSTRNDDYTMGSNQKTITKTETVKDIGVTFHSSLNFEAHVEKKKKTNFISVHMGKIEGKVV